MVLYDFKIRPRRETVILYPETREIFLFARKVLAHRKKTDPEKVTAAEVGKLLSEDYKFAHQWQYGKRKMYDIGELLELAHRLEVPFFLLQKIALGLWDADKAWRVYQSYEKGWEEIRSSIELGPYVIHIRAKVPPAEKESAEKHIREMEQELRRFLDNPEAQEQEIGKEVMEFSAFLDEHGYSRLDYTEEGKRRRVRRRGGVEEEKDEGGEG